MGRREEALGFVAEALDALWPFFEALPPAFADLAQRILAQARQLHSALGRPLPLDLEKRIATFERLMPELSKPEPSEP